MFEHYGKNLELAELVGKKIKEIRGLDEGSMEVSVYTECGQEYLFFHEQDCCESVYLNDFDGDADDLVGATIISAEEVSNPDEGERPEEGMEESWTWTFYKIETSKGGIWMRWLGESNGYYSEHVDFVWVNKPESLN